MYTLYFIKNGVAGNRPMYAYATAGAAKRKANREVAEWAQCPPHLAKAIQAKPNMPTHLEVRSPTGEVLHTTAYKVF